MLRQQCEAISAATSRLRGLSLRVKIAGANILVVVILCGFLVASLAQVTHESEEARALEEAETLGSVLQAGLSQVWDRSSEMEALLSAAAGSTANLGPRDGSAGQTLLERDLVVVDRNLEVLAKASRGEAEILLAGARSDEVRKTIDDGRSRTYSAQQADGHREQVLIAPVEVAGERVGALISRYHHEQADVVADRMRLAIALFAVLGFVVATALGVVIARGIATPLAALGVVAQRFAQGDLSQRFTAPGGGEIGHLASAFNQMANAVETRTKELELLLHAMRTVSGADDLDAALHDLATQLARAIGVPICRVALTSEDGHHLVLRASYSSLKPGPSRFLGWTFPLDEVTPARQVIEGKQLIEIHDPESNLLSEAEKERWKSSGLKGALGVPLLTQGKVIGLLSLGDVRSRRFTEDEKKLCLAVAQQASIAIEKTDLYQRMAEERERLDAIFRNTSDGIVLLDGQRRLVDMNPAMEELTGWTAKEVRDRPCWEIFRSRDHNGASICDLACPMLKSMESGYTVPYTEVVITTKDGRRRDLSVSYAYLRLPSTGAGYGVAITRDISKVKEAEKLKDEFVSLLSHDLCQPVAIIQGRARLLQQRLRKEDLTGETAENLEVMVSVARQLNEMIGDLVDSTRLESGRLELHKSRVSLLDLVSSVLQRRVEPNERPRVHIEAAEDAPVVMADPERLERVVVNLFNNALKFSPRGTEVLVRLRSVDGRAEISVIDRGVGVDAEDLPHLFDRFYRARTGRSTEGLGLGLYIARLLLEAHGGQIWAESPGRGNGSSFHVSLPLASDEGEFTTTAQSAHGAHQG